MGRGRCSRARGSTVSSCASRTRAPPRCRSWPLSTASGMRAVLGLFEGVCTGAADGYARMAERPAATLLHLGPGLANGLANLHNARRAGSPVVNWIGDHASWHLAADAPLTSDIASLARSVGFVRTVTDAASIERDGAEVIAAAYGPPPRVASLIIPVDAQWSDAPGMPPAPKRSPAGGSPRPSGELRARCRGEGAAAGPRRDPAGRTRAARACAARRGAHRRTHGLQGAGRRPSPRVTSAAAASPTSRACPTSRRRHAKRSAASRRSCLPVHATPSRSSAIRASRVGSSPTAASS